MAAEHEHHEELPQGSPVGHQEASTSDANSQVANLTRLVEELTKKHDNQQSQMESIAAENQILKNQLMSINSQAAYSYYYPYYGYSTGANAGGWQTSTSQFPRGQNSGGWQQTTPHYPQGTRNFAHSPVAPMQPLTTPINTTVANERRAQRPQQHQPYQHPQQQYHYQQQQQQQQQQNRTREFDPIRRNTPIRRSTSNSPPPAEGPVLQGTMEVEDMMRSIMAEELRTLESQMEQRFSSQIHRATTSTPGFDDLARGVRETPLSSRITNTITPKFSSISFPKFDGMSDPHDHLLQYKHIVQSTTFRQECSTT